MNGFSFFAAAMPLALVAAFALAPATDPPRPGPEHARLEYLAGT
jgi:hypothetical protein